MTFTASARNRVLPIRFLAGLGRCTASGGGNCPIPSDIRLKRDIVQVSRLENGLGLYRYRYKGSDQVYVGVMAQEVALVRPDAVIRGADGYLRVDYSRLGLHLMTWDAWVASGGEKGLKHAKTAVQSSTQMSDAEMDKVTAGRTIHNQGVVGEAGSQCLSSRCSPSSLYWSLSRSG